jgi:tryptophanyl-tRNA synthetase
MMAEGLKEGLAPIRAKRKELETRSDKVKEIIKDGNDRARAIARETMIQVREAVKI